MRCERVPKEHFASFRSPSPGGCLLTLHIGSSPDNTPPGIRCIADHGDSRSPPADFPPRCKAATVQDESPVVFGDRRNRETVGSSGSCKCHLASPPIPCP